MKTRTMLAVALVLMLATLPAQGAVRAWLQPDRIAFGDVSTLNVETDESGDSPDFAPLLQDFELRGQSSSVQATLGAGGRSTRTLYAVVLEPRRAGTLVVPPVQVGSATTPPLVLTVTETQPGSAERGDPIYLESELGTSEPYVQQAVPYTVRLFYALPLRNGNVEARPPAGASLQQIGEDRNYQQDVGGRRYNVFERNYLLLPERSGTLELPAPQFRGRAPNNDVDAFFDRGRIVSAVGTPRTLEVRPQPADAPTPWLPAANLALTRGALPETTRAGEPLMLELTLQADGVQASQLPELALPAVAGAQVFPEPAKTVEGVVQGRPQVTVTRRFALVPARAGRLAIPPVRIGYWNTTSDRATVASLPEVDLAVEAALASDTPSPAVTDAPATATRPTAAFAATGVERTELRVWQAMTAATSIALALALWWGWRRGRAAPVATTLAARTTSAPLQVRRALAEGDLREIAEALRASTTPRSANLGALVPALADPAQQAALRELERVLWAGGVDPGDRASVRARLREAFRDGPRLRASVSSADGIAELPPIYPTRH